MAEDCTCSAVPPGLSLNFFAFPPLKTAGYSHPRLRREKLTPTLFALFASFAVSSSGFFDHPITRSFRPLRPLQ
jgi:hypothetical protein